jgi:hypothetical protein
MATILDLALVGKKVVKFIRCRPLKCKSFNWAKRIGATGSIAICSKLHAGLL